MCRNGARMKPQAAILFGILGVAIFAATGGATVSVAKARSEAAAAGVTRFAVSFPASLHSEPITGRAFVVITKTDNPEPRLVAGTWGDSGPLYGVDVNTLGAEQTAVIDGDTFGAPVHSLRDLPAGDYYVQAILNIYTEFHRADGHTVWLHMDQWEGQHFNLSPGNLYSEVQKVHLDPATGYDVKLSLTKVVPPIEEPKDTAWVKHVKIQSELLTKFWGHPMYVGAIVLLPKGYEEHPDAHYPVIYEQGHFSLRDPFGFTTDDPPIPAAKRAQMVDLNRESGHEFAETWMSDNFPRMIAVTFQHPTPYYDDSYAVNSVNNGPYGDALVQEMIPYLQAHFRMIPKPYARVLTGGSTGGWESLGAQVFYPDFFGGTWALYPDQVDFRRYQLVNIYEDDNAFFASGHTWFQVPRPIMRTSEGQVMITMQQFSEMEAVLGSHNRSGEQIEIWEAAFGPLGEDGYPKPLWDKRTGKIDHDVARYMRDHGYDLSYNIRTNWPTLGPKLRGKVHVYVGDMDNFYLNLAVYKLEEEMKNLTNPPCDCEFAYGRPMKGHGWQPATTANLVKWMAEYVEKNAGAEDIKQWHY
jgi:hypothetical protein